MARSQKEDSVERVRSQVRDTKEGRRIVPFPERIETLEEHLAVTENIMRRVDHDRLTVAKANSMLSSFSKRLHLFDIVQRSQRMGSKPKLPKLLKP